MKYFFSFFVIMMFSTNVNAVTVEMFGKDKVGYEQPRYILREVQGTIEGAKELITLANHDAFPFSSQEQGSVFSEVIEKIAEKTRIYVKLIYDDKYYKEAVDLFERGDKHINALFGVPKEYYPYSKNEYIYPAFFENKLHVITPRGGDVIINTKEDLLKYKGVYVKKDNLSSFIVKDFSNYKIQSVDDYSNAFELLFTKKIDYIVAGYYPSQIEAYKTGLRDYISYSKEAIWKNPLFIRVDYRLLGDQNMDRLKRYMKTDEFKNLRDSALEEVLEIYKKNTQGVIPPMYIGSREESTQAEDVVK